MKKGKMAFAGWGIPAVVIALLLLGQALFHDEAAPLYEPGVSAFRPHQADILSDESLVDELSRLPLHLRIDKADWNQRTLMLDLKIEQAPGNVDLLYKDLSSVLAFSFEAMSNVDQLYLRFMAMDPWTESRYLMLASRVSKEEYSPLWIKELNSMGKEQVSAELAAELHMTLTNIWLKQFRDIRSN